MPIVQSSNLYSVEYIDSILTIRFHSGGIYQYYGVPSNVYHGLLNAGSKGKYFAAYIKNVYPYNRVD